MIVPMVAELVGHKGKEGRVLPAAYLSRHGDHLLRVGGGDLADAVGVGEDDITLRHFHVTDRDRLRVNFNADTSLLNMH